jgi:hypothetical protein
VLAWRLSKASKEALSNHKDVDIDRSPFSLDRLARIEERADFAFEPLLKLKKQISDSLRYVVSRTSPFPHLEKNACDDKLTQKHINPVDQ